MVIATAPLVMVPIIPCCFVYWRVQQRFRSNAREIQRLASVSRSPVFDAFTEALNGIETIRGFGEEERFKRRNAQRLGLNLSATINQTAAGQWLSIRLSFISDALFAATIIFCVLAHEFQWSLSAISSGGTGSRAITAGLVGLAISKSQEVTQLLEYFIQLFTSAETSLVALERLLQFAKLNPEPPLQIADVDAALKRGPPPGVAGSRDPAKTSAQWPWAGNVVFKKVQMRYRKGAPLVLKGIDLDIPAGSSVGIVGRTGSGKSTLLQCLFRLVDPESGSIEIDGVDLCTMGMERLRTSLAIIPQDPTLFSGTMRDNLDPFHEHNAESLWECLDMVELKSFVEESHGGLDMEIAAKGENLSVGQRQLTCLGRALLRKSKVLVLDEATASVDHKTDKLIQTTLSNAVKDNGSTIIAIAHRINTIIGYDYILVLDDGNVAEWGRPADLLKKAGGHLTSLAVASKIDIAKVIADAESKMGAEPGTDANKAGAL